MKRQVTFDHDTMAARLQAGMAAFTLPDAAAGDVGGLAAQLTTYLAELHKWNRAYNLTAVRDPFEMLTRHIYDSLTALPFVAGDAIADVGTGAGLPGIPLALCYPDRHFTLIDTNGKKTRFVQHAVAHLRLDNVEVVQARVESYVPASLFSSVFSRAFASLADFVAGCQAMTAADGCLVALKGRYPEEEQAALESAALGWSVRESHQVNVPELEGERNILILQRN